jgi:hypothetical protein
MSLSGAVPITCYTDRDCERAYAGKNECNLKTNQCQQVSVPQPHVALPSPTNNGLLQTLSEMISELSNWSSVPGQTFGQKLNYVFAGNPEKSKVASLIILLVAIMLLLF